MPDLAERALHTRISRSADAIRRSFVDNLFYVTGTTLDTASSIDLYTALAYTVRDRMLVRMQATEQPRPFAFTGRQRAPLNLIVSGAVRATKGVEDRSRLPHHTPTGCPGAKSRRG